ncbi:MAG: NADH-quinone oxidoreductase subunit C [Deltaproteobacteria bacterium]|nr:NADH-quinone oxidoreductase subunit C [Deltaproteobacteria bacterium]MCL5276416.1 NADH-quinone oxidoreductase subunit C [Deltaproteobacteria bacterium]
MEAKKIFDILSGKFGGSIQQLQESTFPPSVVVGSDAIVEVCDFLKKAEGLDFLSLVCLSGVDLKEQGRMTVVYHLGSMKHGHMIAIKVELDRSSPHVRTVEKVWPVANWYEREAYDMFGIVFDGHSDLRRILMPEDWEGHPMRKDYVYPKRYHTWDV